MAIKKTDPRNEAFAVTISDHLKTKQIQKQTFAARVGIRRETLYHYLKNPEPMALGTFRVIARDTQMTDEAILNIVRGKR